jgi:DNA-directed RNA polymerase omega subunit
MKRTDVPPHEELMHRIRNRYEFILAVSKRARMLVDGAPSVPEVAGVKPAMKALGEMLGGHIPYSYKPSEDR